MNIIAEQLNIVHTLSSALMKIIIFLLTLLPIFPSSLYVYWGSDQLGTHGKYRHFDNLRCMSKEGDRESEERGKIASRDPR